MKIYSGEDIVKGKKCILALGDFDGVHLGHLKLIKQAKAEALKIKCECGIYTFKENSKKCLGAKNFSHLTTESEKNELFEMAEVDFVCYDDFYKVKDFSPEGFCDYLTEKFDIHTVVCGENYTFGKKAMAGESKLREYMAKKGIYCITVKSHIVSDHEVSSTKIRQLLKSGEIQKANELLGYRYFIDTDVVHGQHIGSLWGFPTINQYQYGAKTVLEHGVYCSICTIDGKRYEGVTNVGVRPTLYEKDEEKAEIFETHIMNYSGDLYGKKVRTEFCKKLRCEKKFVNAEELRKGIYADIQQAKKYFEKEHNI